MRYEHKAIIDAAARDGKFPMEVARELLGHDLLKSMVTTISSHAVAFKNMTEQQQDAAIKTMQDDLTPALDTAIRMIVSQATKTVRMKLKKVAIGKKWQIVGEAEGDEEFLHELADKTQDQSDVLVLLYERDYLQGLDAISGEKDQQDLPLEGDADIPASGKKARTPKAKAEDKPIELPPKLIEEARDFVVIQQNCQISGIQNHLKIGFQKAEALLKVLESEGLVKFVGTDQAGQYELVREAPTVTTEEGEKVEIDPATAEVFYSTAVKAVIKAVSADDSVLRPIYGDDDNAIEVALMRMEDEGIVSAPSPEGLRDVLTLP